MRKPSEYVEVVDEFMRNGIKGIKFEKASREDVASLAMLIYLQDLPLEVKMVKGTVYLLRKQEK